MVWYQITDSIPDVTKTVLVSTSNGRYLSHLVNYDGSFYWKVLASELMLVVQSDDLWCYV